MRAVFPFLLTLFASLPAGVALADGGVSAAFQQALEGGSLGNALLLSFLAGIATSLTPCVYPMIAITVSVFGARAVQTRAEGALLSTAFVAGMTVLFSVLGIAAALTGGIFGDELGNPVIAFGLALVFLVMAASMFGAFELALPYTITTKLSEMGGIGYRGAFVLGMVSSIIAAPCVGPVLGLLLPWVGTTGNVSFGAACMVAYALGMGLLFWVVGTFAVALPKSGRWMEWVKGTFGLIMIGSALYFVRAWIPGYDQIPRASAYLYGALVCVAAGIALGAIHARFSDGGLARARKTLGIFATSLGMLLMMGHLEARPNHAGWEADLHAARAKAKAEAAPLLIDFGASWCQACGELERYTFSDPRVISEITRFIKVKIDLSPGPNVERGKEWLSGYGARGLPLVVVHDSQGNERVRVTEFVEADKMLELLRGVN